MGETASAIGGGDGQVEFMGEVARPAHMMDGALLRAVQYGDYEITSDAYLIDNGNGGAFRVIARYFPEAMEDAGQAIRYMLDSFEITRQP